MALIRTDKKHFRQLCVIFVQKKNCMQNVNPFNTAGDRFIAGRTSLNYFNGISYKCECTVLMICLSGSATISIDLKRNTIKRGANIWLLLDRMLMISDPSKDFEVAYCALSHDFFSEITFRFEPSFFGRIREEPILYLKEDMQSFIEGWFSVLAFNYDDRHNIFREAIARNLLSNIFMEIYDKVRRKATRTADRRSGRQVELFNRFAVLLHEHCIEQREVSFYADRLCISTRYLSAIVNRTTSHSAKEIIDRAVINEIKVLLQSTDLSIQEIAFRLHFPDQSYLGRFFRKRIGMSPMAYRRKCR